MSTQDPKGPAELVPPERSVLLYAIGEFAVCRDLYDLSETGKTLINAIIETLRGMNGAESKKAVGRVVEEVVERWAVESGEHASIPTPTPPPTITPPQSDYDTVCDEIVRREEWLGEMSEAQSEIEALLDEVENFIQKNDEKYRYGSPEETAAARKEGHTLALRRKHIETTRDSFVTLRETAKHDLERLRQYKRALEIVKVGCPAGLLGESIPSIPSFSETDVILKEGDIMTTEGSGRSFTSTDRRAALKRIAEEAGISEAEVIIMSLYDLFGPHNERLEHGHGMRSLNRGYRRVMHTALTMFPDLPWRTQQECYEEVRATDRQLGDSGHIEYRGSLQHSMTFVRTEKPLPWPSSVLFSAEESAAFVASIAQPSQTT